MQQDASGAGNGSPRRFRTVALALMAGVAGGLVAPLLYPSVARNARPVTRKALKAGMAAFERGREIAAELGEQAGDLLAEARRVRRRAQAGIDRRCRCRRSGGRQLARLRPGRHRS